MYIVYVIRPLTNHHLLLLSYPSPPPPFSPFWTWYPTLSDSHVDMCTWLTPTNHQPPSATIIVPFFSPFFPLRILYPCLSDVIPFFDRSPPFEGTVESCHCCSRGSLCSFQSLKIENTMSQPLYNLTMIIRSGSTTTTTTAARCDRQFYAPVK